MGMTPTTTTCTAFIGNNRYASGPVAEVALALWSVPEGIMALVFDDATGQAIDIDTRGPPAKVVVRLEPQVAIAEPELEPRGRGRPRLGVIAKEVTLLPRHWDWLNVQPGGASVALRKLVDEARRVSGCKDQTRQAQEAVFHFMSAMAGDILGFEEAFRALFANDKQRFNSLVAAWPDDVRSHATKLAFSS